MLDEDEIALSWRIDTTPISRGRSRSHYDFERGGESIVLPGSIAYQRLREMEKEDMKRQPVTYSPRRPTSASRVPRLKLEERDEKDTSAARKKALEEYEAELAEAEARRRQKAKEERVDLNSFVVRYEKAKKVDSEENDGQTKTDRLVCEWTRPKPTSKIDYFTIERQIDGGDWQTVGEKIDSTSDSAELEIGSVVADQPIRSRFRLKAELNNGTTVLSEPTEEITIDPIEDDGILIPDVEILASDTVQLSWKNKTPKGNVNPANVYDIEKRDGPTGPWQKIRAVSFAQGLALVDSLNDAEQCQFRLVPSTSNQGKDIRFPLESD